MWGEKERGREMYQMVVSGVNKLVEHDGAGVGGRPP
jgi:hypothetical protein